MTTETGAKIRTTATSGTQATSTRDGLPIMRAIGIGLHRGDIRGLMILHGAMHRSTTDVGYLSADVGDGLPDREQSEPFTRQHWSSLSAGAQHWVQTWDGSRSVRVKFMSHPTR